jgi:hypothetical protein
MAKQSSGNTPTARVGKAFDTFRYYPTTQAALGPQVPQVSNAPQAAVVPQGGAGQPSIPWQPEALREWPALPAQRPVASATLPPWWLEHVAAQLPQASEAPSAVAWPEAQRQPQLAPLAQGSSIIEQFIRMFIDHKKEGGPYTPSGGGGPDFQNGSR